MNDFSPAPHDISLDTECVIDEICDRFEASWKQQVQPSIPEFIQGWQHNRRARLLHELLTLDRHYAARSGNSRDRAYYVALLPDDIEQIDELIASTAAGTADTSRVGVTETDFPGRIEPVETVPQEFPNSIGRYQILRELGRGAFGVVYLADDPRLKRKVAIKRPMDSRLADERIRTTFLREAQLAAKLNHPSIVAIHDIAEDESRRPYIVMEYVAGSSLKERLAQEPYSPSQTVQLITGIVGALQHAHRSGLVHRDLKPANVLIDKDGNPHVADFGLAIQIDSPSVAGNETAGTLAYMSPEQINGREIDARTDLWSLGVILYEMLGGQRPFATEQPKQLCRQILDDQPPPIKQSASADARTAIQLERMARQCLAKQPADRISSADELLAMLHELSKGKSSRSRRLAVGISLLLVFASLIAVLPASRWNRGPSPVTVERKQGILRLDLQDDELSLTVKGDHQTTTIDQVGLHRLPLYAGRQRLTGIRNGRRVLDRTIEIAESEELPFAVLTGQADDGAFQVKGDNLRFETLAGALNRAKSGDEIEINGNGPFETHSLDLGDRKLTIRAVGDTTPVIRLRAGTLDTFFTTRADLSLEGLELQASYPPPSRVRYGGEISLIQSTRASLSLVNCRLTMDGPKKTVGVFAIEPPLLELRNCAFVHRTACCIRWDPPRGGHCHTSNCTFEGGTAFTIMPTNSHLRLEDNTFLTTSRTLLILGAESVTRKRASQEPTTAHVTADRNSFRTPLLWQLATRRLASTDELMEAFEKSVIWRGQRNGYGVETDFVALLNTAKKINRYSGAQDVASWSLLKSCSEQGSLDLAASTSRSLTLLDVGAKSNMLGPGRPYYEWRMIQQTTPEPTAISP